MNLNRPLKKKLEIPESIEKIIIVSDIHAFLLPLREIEKLIGDRRATTQVMFNGDVFGIGPEPIESLEWVMEHAGDYFAAGNNDDNVAFLEPTDGTFPISSFEGIRQALTENHLKYLLDKPYVIDATWRGYTIRLLHSHRLASGEIWTDRPLVPSPEDFAKDFMEDGVSLTVAGNIHIPFVRMVDGKLMANAGSTGCTLEGLIGNDGKLVYYGYKNPIWDDRQSFLQVMLSDGELTAEVVRFYAGGHVAALEKMTLAEEPGLEKHNVIMREQVNIVAEIYEKLRDRKDVSVLEHVRLLKDRMILEQTAKTISKHYDERRYLPLDGTRNTRDVGGYPTIDGGVTRWRRFYRSDTLHRVSPASQAMLIEYGLRTVIDLRLNRELREEPNVFAESERVTYHHKMIIDEELEPELHATQAHWTDRESFMHSYTTVLDRRQQQHCAIVSLLGSAGALPALVHCRGGKDRTGTMTMLVLGVVGVVNEAIIEDYTLSDLYLRDSMDLQRRRTMAENMRAFLDYIDEKYGGIESYLTGGGVTGAQMAYLRKALVE